MKKLNYINLFLIIIGAVSTGFFYNSLSPKGIPLLAEKVVFEEASIDDILAQNNPGEAEFNNSAARNIDLASAYKIYEDSMAVFIDGRDEWEFSDGRIKGAINIPEYSFEDNLDAYNKLDKNRNYVIYCGGEDCDISTRLAQKLNELGFNNLYVFPGGWEEWLNGNFPVESGENNGE